MRGAATSVDAAVPSAPSSRGHAHRGRADDTAATVSLAGLGAHVALLALDDVTSLRIAGEQLGEHAGETLHRVIGSNGADLEARSRRGRLGRRSDHAHDRWRARADRLDPRLDRRTRGEGDGIGAEGAGQLGLRWASATGSSTPCTRRRRSPGGADRRRPCRRHDRLGRRGPTMARRGRPRRAPSRAGRSGRARPAARIARPARRPSPCPPRPGGSTIRARRRRRVRRRGATSRRSNRTCRSGRAHPPAPHRRRAASTISISGTCTTSAPSCYEQRIERAGLVTGRDDRPAAQRQLGRVRLITRPSRCRGRRGAARRAISVSLRDRHRSARSSRTR